MKNQGFTLIELLAVIVILAIIALIAVPIILNIIEDAKNESNKRSVELYASAIKNAIAKEQLNGKIVPAGKYSTTTLPFTVEYEGNVDCEEIEIKESGSVSLAKCTVNGTEVDYTYGKTEETVAKTYSNGEVVYFDVDNGISCTTYTESQSATGVKTGCMKFYAFNDSEESDTVNLLLDHNTTAIIAWNSSESNATGPAELLEQLASDTGSWSGTETPTNYSIDQSGVTSGANYIVDYSTYKARLITAEEIAQITGHDTWDVLSESSNWYYFDSLSTSASATCKSGNTSGCSYGWLYDRTSTNCTTYGCLNNSDAKTYGYWTVSACAANADLAWRVYRGGSLSLIDINDDYSDDYVVIDGVRPVIEVLKSKLN